MDGIFHDLIYESCYKKQSPTSEVHRGRRVFGSRRGRRWWWKLGGSVSWLIFEEGGGGSEGEGQKDRQGRRPLITDGA